MIIRRSHKRNFTTLGNEVVDDVRLSYEALGLLTYLLSRPDDWEIHVAQLTSRIKAGRDKVYRIVGELQKAGYLAHERVRDDGVITGGRWIVREDPALEENSTISAETEPHTENPDVVVEPHTALPDTALPDTANPDAYQRLTGTQDLQGPKEERDARARAGQEAQPEAALQAPPAPEPEKGLTVDAAWSSLLKAWPDIALQSESLARSALSALSGEDRKIAVDRVPAFLAFHREKLGKAKLPFLHNYLGERSRWTTLPADKIAAGKAGERTIAGGFDAPWWWLFFADVDRYGARLIDHRSPESAQLRRHVELARARVGWKADRARIAEAEAGGKALVKIPVDGDEFAEWAKSLRFAGVELPRPDSAKWIFVPTQWPGDEREREARLRDEMAEMNR